MVRSNTLLYSSSYETSLDWPEKILLMAVDIVPRSAQAKLDVLTFFVFSDPEHSHIVFFALVYALLVHHEVSHCLVLRVVHENDSVVFSGSEQCAAFKAMHDLLCSFWYRVNGLEECVMNVSDAGLDEVLEPFRGSICHTTRTSPHEGAEQQAQIFVAFWMSQMVKDVSRMNGVLHRLHKVGME